MQFTASKLSVREHMMLKQTTTYLANGSINNIKFPDNGRAINNKPGLITCPDVSDQALNVGSIDELRAS